MRLIIQQLIQLQIQPLQTLLQILTQTTQQLQTLKQKQLAQKLNVSEQAIAGYEQNARRPNPDMLKDLANFFGVSVDYLLCNDNTSKTLSNATEDKELNKKILQMAQDEFDRTLFKKYGDLSEEKKKLVMAVINGIIEEASKED